MATHDLVDFMASATKQIADEYQRIQKRATEDPGTAGDQGEENWASLLKGWLPHTMHVVTKGRILSEKGIASPQVDVIVLRPEYPSHLLDKKLYLAGGVLAAFECKTTLKSTNIKSFIANSIEIKTHAANEPGTPYKELQSPILYGLLAHSHSWKGATSKPIQMITDKLITQDEELITHPKHMPDLLCVADLACWTTSKMVFMGPKTGTIWNESLAELYGSNGSAISYYNVHSKNTSSRNESFTPIGAFIHNLMSKLAMNTPGLRPLARYYLNTIQIGSEGLGRKWPITIYSEGIRPIIQNAYNQSTDPYNEWCWVCS